MTCVKHTPIWSLRRGLILFIMVACFCSPRLFAGILEPEWFHHYVEDFNASDDELYPSEISNFNAWEFLRANIPLFECPDHDLEEVYYFRWWTYRKHIKHTPDGFIITEFQPDVPWAGKYNSINCAAGHHIYEGRWMHDPKYLSDYSVFWLRKGGGIRTYSFWVADALWNRFLVTGDEREIRELLPDLVNNYVEWEKGNLDSSGLFWQEDGKDGMEVSVGGSGCRATINTYMFADAQAISKIADLLGKKEMSSEFQMKSKGIKKLVQEKLWNINQQFFETLPRHATHLNWAGVRELHGFTPWYANLPDRGFESAWSQIMDTNGFFASYGPTTTERRNRGFALSYQGHECQWNGPGWPYSTSVTLTAMANLLDNYSQNFVGKKDYYTLLKIYAHSQQLKLDSGKVVPWIDDNINPDTGDWMARTMMKSRKGEIHERGKDYNHSTFCDLIINGLIGLRPQVGNKVEISPLIPDGQWDYFCLDNVLYHGHSLSIFYDKTGRRYGKGKGLRVFADGVEIAHARRLQKLYAILPGA